TSIGSDWATCNAEGQRLCHGANARQADELRPEHRAVQEYGVRVLSYAVRRVQRTDPVGQPDDDRVPRILPLPRRQAHRAAIHLRALVPGTSAQRNATAVLRRKLLGLTRNRLPAP